MKTIAVAVVLLLIGLMLTPRYLVYSDPPRKTDIIIQFVGSDRDSRLREARQLVLDGYADYLFIPTLFTLYRPNRERTSLSPIRFADIKPGIDLPCSRTGMTMNTENFKKIRSEYRIPRFYEDTHAEILLAKTVMDVCGFKRAIFVSSSYHMKRIKIMANRVFDPSYDITLVPSRFETRFEVPLPSMKDVQHVVTESPKMLWFLCYDYWGR